METNDALHAEIKRLQNVIKEKDAELEYLRMKLQGKEEPTHAVCNPVPDNRPTESLTKLSNAEIARYSRQLILPEFGVKGQLAVRSASVLVVGCGGLGCPVALYLAAAGVGKLGLVDYDEVELSNLHRQVLHTESRVGSAKSQSVADGCKSLNSWTVCVPYRIALSSNNALQIIEQYDIIVDATDNVATRYLLSDACILASKPLVSGSALRFEGQLTVYNYKGSPCYRCLYPVPPSPDAVTNCSDGGVMGAVVGVIGCMQALEVIKIAADMGFVCVVRTAVYGQRMLLFDGLEGAFRSVRLRGRRKDCAICGQAPSISSLIDYEQFCGSKATDKEKNLHVLKDDERISVWDYSSLVEVNEPHVLIDVRQPVELDICKLPTTTKNIPMEDFDKPAVTEDLKHQLQTNNIPVFVVCRRGNDSQLAVNKIRQICEGLPVPVRDIRGGLHAWARHIDTDFPIY